MVERALAVDMKANVAEGHGQGDIDGVGFSPWRRLEEERDGPKPRANVIPLGVDPENTETNASATGTTRVQTGSIRKDVSAEARRLTKWDSLVYLRRVARFGEKVIQPREKPSLAEDPVPTAGRAAAPPLGAPPTRSKASPMPVFEGASVISAQEAPWGFYQARGMKASLGPLRIDGR